MSRIKWLRRSIKITIWPCFHLTLMGVKQSQLTWNEFYWLEQNVSCLIWVSKVCVVNVNSLRWKKMINISCFPYAHRIPKNIVYSVAVSPLIVCLLSHPHPSSSARNTAAWTEKKDVKPTYFLILLNSIFRCSHQVLWSVALWINYPQLQQH